MHNLILASSAGSSLVVTITIIVDTSAQVGRSTETRAILTGTFLSYRDSHHGVTATIAKTMS